MNKLLTLVSTLIVLASAPATSHDGDEHQHGLEIDQPWVRQTGNRTISAAIYLGIHNKGTYLETLKSVSTNAAARVQIHRSQEEDGIMRMHHIETLLIAPNEALAFEPGGYHIMLTKLSAPLKENDIFPHHAQFRKGRGYYSTGTGYRHCRPSTISLC